MKEIYMEDSYRKDFEAVVMASSGERVILDRTAFYPKSGGQPSDTGILVHEDKKFIVAQVETREGQIVNIVDRTGLIQDDLIHATLDRERRHKFMRYIPLAIPELLRLAMDISDRDEIRVVVVEVSMFRHVVELMLRTQARSER
jgi:hypothetical protein